MKRDTLLILLCYAMVYIVWGTTYFFIKAAVATIPAAFVVAWRFAAGALILAVLAAARGAFSPFPSLKECAGSAAIGIMLLLLGNGLLTEAERVIPSWVGSILIACMPIYVAFFNFLFYRTKISTIRIIGALVGLIGVSVSLYDGSSFGKGLGPAMLIGIAGALAWGLGTSAAKALPKAKDVFASTAIQMTAAALVSLMIGLAGGGDPIGALKAASPSSLFGLAYLSILGSLTLVAYNHLLVAEPSFRVSSYSLVNPVIAVFLGLAAGEKAAPYLAFGILPVLIGIALILYGDILLGRTARKA